MNVNLQAILIHRFSRKSETKPDKDWILAGCCLLTIHKKGVEKNGTIKKKHTIEVDKPFIKIGDCTQYEQKTPIIRLLHLTPEENCVSLRSCG